MDRLRIILYYYNSCVIILNICGKRSAMHGWHTSKATLPDSNYNITLNALATCKHQLWRITWYMISVHLCNFFYCTLQWWNTYWCLLYLPRNHPHRCHHSSYHNRYTCSAHQYTDHCHTPTAKSSSILIHEQNYSITTCPQFCMYVDPPLVI